MFYLEPILSERADLSWLMRELLPTFGIPMTRMFLSGAAVRWNRFPSSIHLRLTINQYICTFQSISSSAFNIQTAKIARRIEPVIQQIFGLKRKFYNY